MMIRYPNQNASDQEGDEFALTLDKAPTCLDFVRITGFGMINEMRPLLAGSGDIADSSWCEEIYYQSD